MSRFCCIYMFMMYILFSTNGSLAFEYFHPKSTLELTLSGNTRTYTFNPQNSKNFLHYNNTYQKNYDPYPLIIDEALIVSESIYVRYPNRFPTRFSGERSEQILTSISIPSGEVNFAIEILQPVINSDIMLYREAYSCDIRGIYKWNDKIVVVISYDNDSKNNPYDYEHPYVYIIDCFGNIITSYNLEGFDIYSLGVDEENDRLVMSDSFTIYLGSPVPKKNAGETPQIVQMNLNTGEIIRRDDYYPSLFALINPEGFMYYYHQERMEIYSLEPFQLIKELTITPFIRARFFPKFWRGLLWEYSTFENQNGKRVIDFHAYNPNTMERVETEETPYCFIQKINGISYLIEEIIDYSNDVVNPDVAIRITNLTAEVESWEWH